MSRSRSHGGSDFDGLGQDAEIASWLRAVDPASRDPNYWLRFRSWVVERAGPELARRRLMAEVTIEDVLTSWARTVVPTALMAAAVAALMIVRAESVTAPLPVGVEEVLVAELEGQPIPAALAEPEAGAAVMASLEIF